MVRCTVESALKSAALCEPDSEVLVAVNGATDGDQLAGLASPQLRVLHLSRRSAPGARNAALAAARNDTVLFADDDCTLPPSWCRDLELHHALEYLCHTFVWTATADEILAKVRLVETNIKKLVDNNAQ